jgi:hypothetical protein
METRRRVTEEDLLVTEALIARSYGNLKQSVVEIPSRAFHSLGKTMCDHPYATAGTAVIGGAAIYGIVKMMTSYASVQDAKGSKRAPVQKDTGHMDILQQMLPILIPLITPYIAGYLQKYLGSIQSSERG